MREFAVKKENPSQEKKKIGIRSKKFTETKHRTVGVCDLFGNESEIGNRCERNEKTGTFEGTNDCVLDDDDEFLVQEYESEQEDEEGGVSKRKGSVCLSSDEDEDEDAEDKLEEEEEGLKVYFCSRTHSQLSQFIRELRKTVFGSELKVVSLASRKNLCINQGLLSTISRLHVHNLCNFMFMEQLLI